MSDDNSTTKPMTGAEHVREALRLADLAEQDRLDLPAGGTYTPTDEQRYRILMRAHLHASLARTAAMVDTTRWSRRAWHEVFAVNN